MDFEAKLFESPLFFFVTMLDKEHFVRCLSGQCPQGNAYLVCFIMYIYNAHGRSCKGFVVRFIELKKLCWLKKFYELIINIFFVGLLNKKLKSN